MDREAAGLRHLNEIDGYLLRCLKQADLVIRYAWFARCLPLIGLLVVFEITPCFWKDFPKNPILILVVSGIFLGSLVLAFVFKKKKDEALRLMRYWCYQILDKLQGPD